MRIVIPVLLTAALVIGTGSALACDGLGENMHMGNIVSIDRTTSTFVILDAQTQKPISFISSKDALTPFAVNDTVEVGYQVIDDGKLRSVSLVHL